MSLKNNVRVNDTTPIPSNIAPKKKRSRDVVEDSVVVEDPIVQIAILRRQLAEQAEVTARELLILQQENKDLKEKVIINNGKPRTLCISFTRPLYIGFSC